MQPESPAPNAPHQPNNKKFFIILGICIAVIIGAVIGLVMILSSSLKVGNDGSKGGSTSENVLTVGSNPYLYACGALTRDDIASVSSALPADRVGESFKVRQAIPYAQITDKQYDLTKTVNDPYNRGSIDSNCEFVVSGDERKQVKITVSQYKTGEEASKSFASKKKFERNPLAFNSLKETSFIEGESRAPRPGDTTRVRSYFVVKNSIVEFQYEMGDVTVSEAPTKLDSLVKKISSTLSNATDATKPRDFSGAGTIGQSKLVDSCRAIDFAKASSVLGNVTYNRANVDGVYSYGPLSAEGKVIRSNCDIDFVYDEDKEKQPSFENISVADSAIIYPNNLGLEAITYASGAEATAALEHEKSQLPRKTLLTPIDFNYGGLSMAYSQESDYFNKRSTTHTYKTVKGSSILVLSLEQTKVEEPYQSTVKTFQNNVITSLFDSFKLN